METVAANTDPILKAVAALANDLGASGQPGYLVLGVDSQTGNPVARIRDEDQVQLDLVNRIESTRLVPTPSYTIEVVHLQHGSVAVVTVQPYPVPPAVTVHGVPWVRRGTPP